MSFTPNTLALFTYPHKFTLIQGSIRGLSPALESPALALEKGKK
jgi:hypothetical protein